MPKAVDDDSYEDLLSLWSDLESGMGILLAHPASVQDFPRKIAQYDRWMQALLQQDTDASLYLLFQLATTSTVGKVKVEVLEDVKSGKLSSFRSHIHIANTAFSRSKVLLSY